MTCTSMVRGIYGKVNSDFSGSQPQCGFLRCHVFFDNVVLAGNLAIGLRLFLCPLRLDWTKQTR
jgi:hypothetical protein